MRGTALAAARQPARRPLVAGGPLADPRAASLAAGLDVQHGLYDSPEADLIHAIGSRWVDARSLANAAGRRAEGDEGGRAAAARSRARWERRTAECAGLVALALAVPLGAPGTLRALRSLGETVERWGSAFDDRDLELVEDRLAIPGAAPRAWAEYERYILTGEQIVPLERVARPRP